jgi:hypothetical protein
MSLMASVLAGRRSPLSTSSADDGSDTRAPTICAPIRSR